MLRHDLWRYIFVSITMKCFMFDVFGDILKTFTELIEAASKGSQHGLDQFSGDLVTAMDAVEGEKSMYTVCSEDLDDKTLTFCFGKAIGSDLGTTV